MYDVPGVVEESRCFEDFEIRRGKEERKELYLQALKQYSAHRVGRFCPTWWAIFMAGKKMGGSSMNYEVAADGLAEEQVSRLETVLLGGI